MNEKLKALIGTVAPTLATALGGPLAGVAVKAIADKFTDGDTTKLPDYFSTPRPEDLVALKELDNKFEVEMRRLDVELESLAVKDKGSARTMAEKLGFWPQVVLSALFVGGYFALFFQMTMGVWNVPDDAKELTAALMGVLTAAVIKILDFWFGSSVGSKQKTALAYQQVRENGNK